MPLTVAGTAQALALHGKTAPGSLLHRSLTGREPSRPVDAAKRQEVSRKQPSSPPCFQNIPHD
ncbi:hypothetical protein AD947_12480 [Acetobacter tropicalis]|nr:hypothetical protein AD947_12480 [Acetobacter tropicalis]